MNRYVGNYGACALPPPTTGYSDVGNAIYTLYQNLKNYKNSVVTKIFPYRKDFEDYGAAYAALTKKIDGMITPLKGVRDKMQGDIDYASDPETGLAAKFNCFFMKKELDRVDGSICG